MKSSSTSTFTIVTGFVLFATVGCSSSTQSRNPGYADRNTAADTRSAANLSLADKDFAVTAAQEARLQGGNYPSERHEYKTAADR